MEKNILNLIAFCILMENRNGILGKSPDYVREKFQRYCLSEVDNEWMWGLDEKNFEKLKEYAQKWLKEDLEEEIKKVRESMLK